ncbi:DUF4251 domain-containing protein [Salinimicrobium flavum]|uniref:DUF4251 domain-containing protein n=1 Tax=Salinimicrobium flavum TaxID=1737065 RepID=A0ABW5J257_9FLAO
MKATNNRSGNVVFQDHLRIFLVLMILGIFLGCAGGKEIESAEELQKYEDLREKIISREFEIESDWAMPQSGNRVNLLGNANFIRFKGDSVNLFLPYFGVRHYGGGFGTEGGITYEGLAEDLRIEENKRRSRIELRFKGESGSEDLTFYITLFPNGNANTSVTSSQRSSISYQGKLREPKGSRTD